MTDTIDPVELLRANVTRVAMAYCAMVNVDVDAGEVQSLDMPFDAPKAAVRLGLTGGLDASVVLLASEPAVLGALLGADEHLVDSAIAELGNVIGSHLLIGLEAVVGSRLSITPPESTSDPVVCAAWVGTGRGAWVELQGRTPIVVVLRF